MDFLVSNLRISRNIYSTDFADLYLLKMQGDFECTYPTANFAVADVAAIAANIGDATSATVVTIGHCYQHYQ